MIQQEGRHAGAQRKASCNIRNGSGRAGMGQLVIRLIDEFCILYFAVFDRAGDDIAFAAVYRGVIALSGELCHPVICAGRNAADRGGLILVQLEGTAAADGAVGGGAVFAVLEKNEQVWRACRHDQRRYDDLYLEVSGTTDRRGVEYL